MCYSYHPILLVPLLKYLRWSFPAKSEKEQCEKTFQGKRMMPYLKYRSSYPSLIWPFRNQDLQFSDTSHRNTKYFREHCRKLSLAFSLVTVPQVLWSCWPPDSWNIISWKEYLNYWQQRAWQGRETSISAGHSDVKTRAASCRWLFLSTDHTWSIKQYCYWP